MRRILLALLTVTAVFLTGCSDDGGDGDTSPAAGATATDQPTETESESESETESGDDSASLEVADSDLGEILVDADGMTAYVFFADKRGESTCYGECESAWPPITVDDEPVAGDGVDESLLGTTERDDGSIQVTYDDQPLYLFGADEGPGDTNGQGVGDVWYVVAPDGTAIEDAPEAMTTSDGNGYTR